MLRVGTNIATPIEQKAVPEEMPGLLMTEVIMTNTIIEQIDISYLCEIAKKAGKAILDVYRGKIEVERKDDLSPLTEADRRSHDIIEALLKERYPYPVLSEESKDIPYEQRRAWEFFWLVDPLDGTKEFIKRNGEFTVNIALIHFSRPVCGVIYAPALDVLYHAVSGRGAFKIQSGRTERLPLKYALSRLTIVGSRSHATKEFEGYIKTIKETFGDADFISAGSSLKFCLIAEGRADIYPRLGPTMEWDTAAGQAIVEAAGGQVVCQGGGGTLKYNKMELRNPNFFVFGGTNGA